MKKKDKSIVNDTTIKRRRGSELRTSRLRHYHRTMRWKERTAQLESQGLHHHHTLTMCIPKPGRQLAVLNHSSQSAIKCGLLATTLQNRQDITRLEEVGELPVLGQGVLQNAEMSETKPPVRLPHSCHKPVPPYRTEDQAIAGTRS